MMRFKTIQQLVQAIAEGKVPVNVVSPGFAAAKLDITRQSLHKRLKRGTLRAWGAEGYIFVDYAQVRDEVRRKRGIGPGQVELFREST